MSLIYSSEGYFCENDVHGDWQFSMELGKILLTNQYLSLLKKSNINLTEIGTSIDNYNEGYKIPLDSIRKVYPLKQGKIHTVKVETRDNHQFSITLADNETYGKNRSEELSEIINSTILHAIKAEDMVTNKNLELNSDISTEYCKFCGSTISPKAKYCKNCGMKL
ncbi:MAG: zinc ribbon domain-containing protein [Promethearchaeota archaeon]|nr:MAG: zinc ribbon domain-containing protein [Candidatus Lokiarchaeota archaeon]